MFVYCCVLLYVDVYLCTVVDYYIMLDVAAYRFQVMHTVPHCCMLLYRLGTAAVVAPCCYVAACCLIAAS